ncbi:hypothetical protein [Dongia sp.]|uniref:hypothetical protein n=1 Tax=Dongia sp. TaxID=1977262 RepID=UPI0035B16C32
MRISCDRADVDFRPDASRYLVMLDGHVLPLCITADSDAGKAICYVTGNDGQPVKNPVDPTELLRVTKRGRIEIVLPAGQGRA